MSRVGEWLERRSAVEEALLVWAASFAAIVVTYLFFNPWAKLVATASFLYLPLVFMRRRGEDFADYGLSFRSWRADLKLFCVLMAVIVPLFFVGFWGFVEVMRHLPPWLQDLVSPLSGDYHFRPRLPARFHEWVIDQVLVVAVPEEFFYRGFLYTRLRDAWPQGRRIFGVRVGPAFLCAAVLFAVGHLAVFKAWRLAVFFPALLFGWMRERTGSVMGAAALHASCNLYELILEASFFGKL